MHSDQLRSVRSACAPQVNFVRGVGDVNIVEHETYHHNVPQFLQQRGELVPLLKRELVRCLMASELHSRAGGQRLGREILAQ